MRTEEELLLFILENCESIEFGGTVWTNDCINKEHKGDNTTKE